MSETSGGAFRGGRISLGHLIALNDEIAALTRAGLPLEQGLREVGRDLSGGLSSAMLGLAARMDQGASLGEALAADGDKFPPIYRAVVEAGLRADRLPAALESLAGFVRSYADARRTIGLALWYPLTVLVLAYALIILLVTQVVPRFLGAFLSLRIPIPPALGFLTTIGETAVYWGPILPVLLLLLALWWAWTGNASGFRSSRAGLALRWFPWMGAMMAQFEAANLSQMLAILLENGVPYPEAIVLAASSSGDPAMMRAGREIAQAVERGDLLGADRGARCIPPLLRWLLVTGRRQSVLTDALRQVAAIYRKRAMHQAEKIKAFLPAILLLAIGVSATLLYALALFVPFAALLRGLATPAH